MNKSRRTIVTPQPNLLSNSKVEECFFCSKDRLIDAKIRQGSHVAPAAPLAHCFELCRTAEAQGRRLSIKQTARYLYNLGGLSLHKKCNIGLAVGS
jgi:hypothetical protein